MLVNMPAMQREILAREFGAQRDLEVVESAATTSDLMRVARRTRAEFVITSAARVDADAVGNVLDGFPGIKVLALSESGRQGLLYELRPHRVPLEDLSSEVLLATIRQARRATTSGAARSSAASAGSNGKRR